MTFFESMNEIRNQFKEDLNAYLVAHGLSAVNVLCSTIGLEKKPLSIAVFPTKTSGSTFSQSGDTGTIRFAVYLYCNCNAVEEGAIQGEQYFSALLDFINDTTFGNFSALDDSKIIRMDEGEDVNGGIFWVSANTTTQSDGGWD